MVIDLCSSLFIRIAANYYVFEKVAPAHSLGTTNVLACQFWCCLRIWHFDAVIHKFDWIFNPSIPNYCFHLARTTTVLLTAKSRLPRLLSWMGLAIHFSNNRPENQFLSFLPSTDRQTIVCGFALLLSLFYWFLPVRMCTVYI